MYVSGRFAAVMSSRISVVQNNKILFLREQYNTVFGGRLAMLWLRDPDAFEIVAHPTSRTVLQTLMFIRMTWKTCLITYLGPTPSFLFIRSGVEWVLKMCISHNFPSDADVAVMGTILCYPCPGAVAEEPLL